MMEGGKEEDDLPIEDEDLDMFDGVQIGDQVQRTGFWQPLVQVADAHEVNHVQILFAACGTTTDKHWGVSKSKKERDPKKKERVSLEKRTRFTPKERDLLAKKRSVENDRSFFFQVSIRNSEIRKSAKSSEMVNKDRDCHVIK